MCCACDKGTLQKVYSNHLQSLPFFYPLNVLRFLNGSTLPPGAQVDTNTVVGVFSLMSEEDYTAELKKQHFGMYTPLDFQGYNQATFPFWSSEPFTYASAMLALTQYRSLATSGQFSSI